MTETPKGLEILPINELRSKLTELETKAATSLGIALEEKGVPNVLVEQYKNIFPETTGEQAKRATRFSLDLLRENPFLTLTVSGFLAKAGIRVVTESGGDPQKAALIVLDSAIHWAGESATSPENLAFLTAMGGVLIYLGAPATVYDWIGRRTAERVKRDAETMELRSRKEQAIREGKADLDGKVGPNIQIDVGKSDPSIRDLLTLFHASGLRVVSYWDSENQFFGVDPAWQRTNNDWTNRETLKRGDMRESLCSVMLVSHGDDVFLSSRKQDPTRQMQDMTDNEAIGAIHARDTLRKKMGLPPIQHILVSNPQRIIEIGIVRKGEAAYKPKTVGQVISEWPSIYLVDPDVLILRQLAEISAQQNLPLELLTNEERRVEYEDNLKKTIELYNQMVDSGTEKHRVWFAEPEDKANTLTVVYGSTDEDTIAQITTYGREFSKSGDLVAIINDPEKLARLPEGTKSICVGTTIAEAVYQKFFELVSQGAVKV